MNTDSNYIDKLTGLSDFLEKQVDLDACLHELASQAADILSSKNCSIMLLKERDDEQGLDLRVFAHFGSLPKEAFRERMNVRQGISGHVAASGKALLIEDIENSQFSSVARRHYPSKCLISAPIILNQKVIGVIHVNTPKHKHIYNTEDLNLLNIVAMLVSKSIQVIQVQKLMQSKYTIFAMAERNKEELASIAATAGQDLDKVAKLLAKTFYREMSKAGFGPDHIINAASEIISLLNESVAKHKKRRERT